VAARRGIDLFVKRVIGFKGSSSTPGGHGGPPLQYVRPSCGGPSASQSVLLVTKCSPPV